MVAALGDFPDVDWRFRPIALLLSLLAFTIYLFGSAEVWRRLLRALGPELPPCGRRRSGSPPGWAATCPPRCSSP